MFKKEATEVWSLWKPQSSKEGHMKEEEQGCSGSLFEFQQKNISHAVRP